MTQTVIEIGKENSIFNNFIAEIRDEKIQQDRLRFRHNLERIGEILAFKASYHLDYQPQDIKTQLGIASMNLISEIPVLATILRAGLGTINGFLRFFDNSDTAFVSAYRYHDRFDEISIRVDYCSTPNLDNKTLILVDPMIATGKSIVQTVNVLKEHGDPKKIIICGVIGSEEGIEYLKLHLPKNAVIIMGAIDAELTANSYIVPGLGDAGDLAFGKKDK